jgi:hypothetical protein
MFSLWSRTQKSTPRPAVGGSVTLRTENLATRHCTKPASAATSLSKLTTSFSLTTHLAPKLKVGCMSCGRDRVGLLLAAHESVCGTAPWGSHARHSLHGKMSAVRTIQPVSGRCAVPPADRWVNHVGPTRPTSSRDGRASPQRPRRCHAADKRDELAPSQHCMSASDASAAG